MTLVSVNAVSTVLPGLDGRVRTSLLAVESKTSIAKPVLPVWADKTADARLNPGGAVQAICGNGELSQYSNEIEPRLLELLTRNCTTSVCETPGSAVDNVTER